MRTRTTYTSLLVMCATIPLIVGVTVNGHTVFSPNSIIELQEQKGESKKAEVSEAESKAAQKVLSAPDIPGKFKATAEFLKKYPKSTLRPQVAGHIAAKINEVADTAQQISLSEEFVNVFKESGDGSLVFPLLINAYLKSSRIDDAFRIAASMLEKDPDDVEVLTQMAIAGTQQAQAQNPKYIQQSQQYGTGAISRIEADKKPAKFDDVQWKEFRSRWLPDLFLSMGVLSLATGNAADAQNHLQKAVSLNPVSPFPYALLGNIKNNEYQEMARQFNAMQPGQAKDELLKRSQEKLEQTVDLYAHAVAVSEGNAQYQHLHDQVLQDLESYYKYLHNGSTDGLRALIDRYKKTSP